MKTYFFTKELIARVSRMRCARYARDIKFASACKQRDLTQMRNVLLDLGGKYRRNCNFANACLMKRPRRCRYLVNHFESQIALVQVKTSITANTLIPSLNGRNIQRKSFLYLTNLKENELARYELP